MSEPTTAVDELTVSTGAGITVKVSAADVPPPGPGVTTVTGNAPAVERSAAEIVACSCVPLTNVVGRAEPFQAIAEDDTNLLPSTVSVIGAAPATASVTDIEERIGTGLIAASTVNVGLVA